MIGQQAFTWGGKKHEHQTWELPPALPQGDAAWSILTPQYRFRCCSALSYADAYCATLEWVCGTEPDLDGRQATALPPTASFSGGRHSGNRRRQSKRNAQKSNDREAEELRELLRVASLAT